MTEPLPQPLPKPGEEASNDTHRYRIRAVVPADPETLLLVEVADNFGGETERSWLLLSEWSALDT